MGGKALHNTRRINNEEFEYLVNDIQACFSHLTTNIEPLKPVSEKSDHGDIDMLIDSNISIEQIAEIGRIRGVQEMRRNGDTLHLAWPIQSGGIAQIDIKCINWESIENARAFLWYGDVGNLVGKLVRGSFLGVIRWNYLGLYRRVWTPDQDKLLDVLFITLDRERIFKFLDLDFKRWSMGFANEVDTFEFVAKSSMFHQDFFDPKNLRHDQKEDYKRPGYKRFLEWMHANALKSTAPIRFTESEIDDLLLHNFGLNPEIPKELRSNWELRKNAHQKFSGKDILRYYPEMPGPRIGKLVNSIRSYYGGDTPIGWDAILKTEFEDILKIMRVFEANEQ